MYEDKNGSKEDAAHLSKLWNIDKTSEVLEVGTFVIKIAEALMLQVITITERLQRVHILCSYMGKGERIAVGHGHKQFTDSDIMREACLL